MSVITAAESINQANQVFWDEMCGTVLAKKLGITDFSAQSLAKFDQWFFDFYPFLKKYFNGAEALQKAFENYANEVMQIHFPSKEHSYE